MTNNAERQISESSWKRARAFSWVMLAGSVFYVVIGLLRLGRGSRLSDLHISDLVKDIVFAACVGAALLSFLLAAFLRRSLLAEDYVRERLKSMTQVAQHYLHANILVSSLCELPAVMGLVYFLLTGHLLRMVILAAAGVTFSIVLFPSRSKLEDLLRQGGRWGETES